MLQCIVEARAAGNIEWQFQGRSNIVGYHNGKVDVATRNSLVNIAERKNDSKVHSGSDSRVGSYSKD